MAEIRDRRNASWFWMDKDILDTHGSTIGPYGIAVYTLLARYADAKGQSFPSFATIAKIIGTSRPTVIKAMAVLEKVGLVSRGTRKSQHGDADTNVYTLLHLGGGKGDLPPSEPDLPQTEVVKEIYHLVNEVNNGGKGDLPQVVNHVYTNKNYSEQELLNKQEELCALPPQKPAGVKKPKRAHFVPEYFVVTDAMRVWAKREVPGVNIDYETRKFRDHEFDKAKSDWTRTWYNWMRWASEKLRHKPATASRNHIHY